ncbi:hypothetical protein SAMN05443428_11048 [Caloramator quimbayensis]|uniref:Uncharacterized protein n=1 Tax=Caloramator quimbayensis TaxID=1147123 RepID=A0A1T4XKV0_9CLOT|nr:hypothetical protein [Caloramator quimbayensis]SKA90182.1 hypothetical protein SAMN05443428_11048 [Caloramator quimbayensis]
MSRRHRFTRCCCEYKKPSDMYECYGESFNIYSLCILILVILQFGSNGRHKDKQIIDNSILYIITLFLLINCSCKKY